MAPHFVSLDDAHTGRSILLSSLQRTDLVDLETIDGVLADGARLFTELALRKIG